MERSIRYILVVAGDTDGPKQTFNINYVSPAAAFSVRILRQSMGLLVFS